MFGEVFSLFVLDIVCSFLGYFLQEFFRKSVWGGACQVRGVFENVLFAVTPGMHLGWVQNAGFTSFPARVRKVAFHCFLVARPGLLIGGVVLT